MKRSNYLEIVKGEKERKRWTYLRKISSKNGNSATFFQNLRAHKKSFFTKKELSEI